MGRVSWFASNVSSAGWIGTIMHRTVSGMVKKKKQSKGTGDAAGGREILRKRSTNMAHTKK